ncbi:MAG: cytochrome b/b6 domain-containing protein [Selenomonas sp.]|nr:cytochrome b/b6 domain-containing protein [Selenomonas sp.]
MLVNKKYVKRHSKGFVYLHWINAVCFFMLFLTALPLYADTFRFLYDIFGPATLQNAHRFFAVIFVLNPIVGLITARDGIWRMFSEVFKFNGKDVTFLVKFPLELIGKHPEGMPKQGFYNGGERMNIALQLATWGVLVGSGALLWFGEGIIDNSIRAWMIPLHSLCAGIGFAGSIGHIYLALIANPDSVHGMQDGTVKIDYANAHHGEWIDDMVREGKIDQKELNEALKS